MKLAVIGTGYVGLVSGVCFSELGFTVTCVDQQADKIEALRQGQMPIFEPGLDLLVASNAKSARLSFTTDLATAVAAADIVMIAVGTPPDPANGGQADLSYMYTAAREIARSLSGYTIVVTKSTVPVGTNRQVHAVIAAENPAAEFDVASNPEFLREGSAIDDFMAPDRIVIGVEADRAAHCLADLYQPLTSKGFALLRTDIETAEMIKYASNAFLATKIAFINEMADICEKVGANVELVAKGMGMDNRIGERFLRPGPGFGGSCFPKDAMALAQLADAAGVTPHIVNTVIRYNLNRRDNMAMRVFDAMEDHVSGKRIAVLGLTFKANTDDMRESPSLSIIPPLLAAGAHISTYDPEGMANAKAMLSGSIEWCENASTAIDNADAVVIVTEWDEFRQLDLQQIAKRMRYPCVIDLRNLFLPETMRAHGFDYYSIGRRPVMAAAERLAMQQIESATA